MATLNTVFKQVFGEGLKEHGFVKIKGRQPYLVRVVGDEIIHVITCRNEWCGKEGYKDFGVFAGVMTVYRKAIDLTRTPRQNSNSFRHIRDLFVKANRSDDTYWKTLNEFLYKADDEESLRNEMQHVLGETKKIILPILDEVTDLDACIKYFRKYQSSIFYLYNYEEYVIQGGDDEDEGLLYIKADNHDDFKKEFEETVSLIEHEIALGKSIWDSSEEFARSMEEARLRHIANRDYIYNNPEVYAEAMEELERRKRKNTEALRSYGLDI